MGTESGDSSGEWGTEPGAGGRLQRRRLGVFLGVTFAVSWATAGVIYALGGIGAGPTLALGIPLWLVLLAGPYMWGPAVGHVATRWLTDEGFDRGEMLLRVRTRPLPWVLGWTGPLVLILAGAALYFLVFPGRFGGMAAVADLLATVEAQTGQEIPLSPSAFLAVQLVQALVAAPLLNSAATFGEEFGWRAYLLPKLEPLGWRRALVVHGVVWGVWHWPVIAMGHNYGLDYTGAPWLGLLAMTVATVGLGVFLGWITLRSASVFPAVVGHAMINGSAGLATLFATAVPNLVVGPTPVGLIGILPWFAVAAVLFVRTDWLYPGETGRAETGAESA
ncbi:abortive infection protein [Halosimplex carlsbadense 2-9-1]|uniref:Abortive infection protein n=1 Tax=Halosimplex carlsbadense 2-9-1 TaxID=797114 RepID=M0CVZ2_9EURY|nr:CPBP family intramembrane glutamic endopeptidase [Halosimplex carlsbadense]ELZ26823.1 abortive infection protein [Halosimplex carlsbadense 2-9-1]